MAKDQNPEEEKPVKIDKWDGSAVKNALDDNAKKVLVDKFGCVESHSLMDGRLLICTVSVLFAAFALIWDYVYPFPESRPVLIVCVLSYFLMMGVLTLYTSFKEKGCFLVALDKDKAGIDPDNVWYMSSQLKRYDDMYHLFATYTDGQTKESRTGSFSKCIANFVDESGQICQHLYEPEVRKLLTSLSTEKKRK